MELKTPSDALVKTYIDKFNNDKRYAIADDIIYKLIARFPENKQLDDILIKVSVINDLYGTNIFATFDIANHILSLDIDDRLQAGDPGLVDEIATGHGLKSKRYGKELRFYSFATKYCNWHNQSAYPIFDSFVERILLAYKRKTPFSKFTQTTLRDYPTFINVIQDFKARFELKNENLKQLDKFLWMYGKEYFKKSEN